MAEIYDYTISQEDLRQLTDLELARYLMWTDRDRKDLAVAEKIYWWCVEEINYRSGQSSEML